MQMCAFSYAAGLLRLGEGGSCRSFDPQADKRGHQDARHTHYLPPPSPHPPLNIRGEADNPLI